MSFWQAKTKISRADQLFSVAVRTRDNWHCVYMFKCGGKEDFSLAKQMLTCSHYIKRRHRNVRFSLKNCDSACRKCHRFVEDDPKGAEMLKEFKILQLGEHEHKRLLLAGQMYCKKDPKLELMLAKQILKEQLALRDKKL